MATKAVVCVLLLSVLCCGLAKPGNLRKREKQISSKSKYMYKTKPIPKVPVLPPPSVCDGFSCGIGRECIVTREREPSCQCVESCQPHDHQICGTDGVTYPNKCELHRAACVQETKITQVKVGLCDPTPTAVKPRAHPSVCYQADRNALQHELVQSLQTQLMEEGWFQKGKQYSDVVNEYFLRFDKSRDAALNAREFMEFAEHNNTVRNDNQRVWSMCVDALLEEADEDFDWQLNQKEFLRCLRSDFEPDTKMCSLEGRTYVDGDVTQNRCNDCVCACGNWICTANACDGDMIAGTDRQEEYDPAEENAMNDRELKAIMKKLAKIGPEQFPAHVKNLKELTDSIALDPKPTFVTFAPEEIEQFGVDEALEEAGEPFRTELLGERNILGDTAILDEMAQELGLDVEELEQVEEIAPFAPALGDVEIDLDEEVEDTTQRTQDVIRRKTSNKRRRKANEKRRKGDKRRKTSRKNRN